MVARAPGGYTAECEICGNQDGLFESFGECVDAIQNTELTIKAYRRDGDWIDVCDTCNSGGE